MTSLLMSSTPISILHRLFQCRYSNSRDVVVSSCSFSRSAARAPRRACSQATPAFNLESGLFFWIDKKKIHAYIHMMRSHTSLQSSVFCRANDDTFVLPPSLTLKLTESWIGANQKMFPRERLTPPPLVFQLLSRWRPLSMHLRAELFKAGLK